LLIIRTDLDVSHQRKLTTAEMLITILHAHNYMLGYKISCVRVFITCDKIHIRIIMRESIKNSS